MIALRLVATAAGVTAYALALVAAFVLMGAVALVVPARFLKENTNDR